MERLSYTLQILHLRRASETAAVIGLRKVEQSSKTCMTRIPRLRWRSYRILQRSHLRDGTGKAQRFCLLAVVAWQNVTRTCNKTDDTGDTTNNEPILCVIKMRSVCTISHTQTDWSSDTASKPLRFRSLAEYLPLVRLLFIESTHEVTDESWRPHQKRHMKAGFCFRFELSWIFKSWAPCGGYGCSPISMLGRLWLPLNFKRFSFFFPSNAIAFWGNAISWFLGQRSNSAPGICCERNKEACQSRVCCIVWDKNQKEMQSQSAQAIRHSSNRLLW